MATRDGLEWRTCLGVGVPNAAAPSLAPIHDPKACCLTARSCLPPKWTPQGERDCMISNSPSKETKARREKGQVFFFFFLTSRETPPPPNHLRDLTLLFTPGGCRTCHVQVRSQGKCFVQEEQMSFVSFARERERVWRMGSHTTLYHMYHTLPTY